MKARGEREREEREEKRKGSYSAVELRFIPQPKFVSRMG